MEGVGRNEAEQVQRRADHRDLEGAGGRGADAWMIVIPVVALVVAGSLSEGGLDAVLLTLERAIRHTLTAGLGLITRFL